MSKLAVENALNSLRYCGRIHIFLVCTSTFFYNFYVGSEFLLFFVTLWTYMKKVCVYILGFVKICIVEKKFFCIRPQRKIHL